ncbi:hypothetical protein NQ314_020351 [Rhamnusium bicolor]|uniref:Uncharacterized protein n=1 Tax=Rhamnusium bicolor TaxID=1586634 RepID=A0AAV8WL97_9CUCU|nr:hypothetical protein NQ314_020351 [Rhamnusium bicolor]
MTRQGLTEQEEKHLLLLLEGDVSDIDNEESDGEIDLQIPDASNIPDYTLPVGENIGVAYEVDEKSVEEEHYDAEDDIPLSLLFQKKNSLPQADFLIKKKKTKYRWRHKDIDLVVRLYF